MGYRVTVYEATSIVGGMLRHGIPEYRLARRLIDKEIDKIRKLGIEILFNTPLHENFGLDELSSRALLPSLSQWARNAGAI